MHTTVICEALQRRRLLRFHYKEYSTPTVVEPYVYGENKARHVVLSAWLVSGETHDSRPPFWRMYLADEMRSVEILPDEFAHDRPGYKRSDSRFELVRCRVSPPRPFG